MLQYAEPTSRLAPNAPGLGSALFLQFDQVVVVDFEFLAGHGEPQTPVCMVARELRSGREYRLWQDDLRQLQAPHGIWVLPRARSLTSPALSFIAFASWAGRSLQTHRPIR